MRQQMTTKRLITLIILGLIVSAIAGGSIFLYSRWNSPPKILRRAELAIRADKLDKAKALADSYIAACPDDWKGYFILGQAYNRQGKYELARQALTKAGPLEPNEPSIVLAHAETYSLPATRALMSDNGPPTIKAIKEAISKLHEAVRVLSAFEPNETSAIQINEAIGLDCQYLAMAYNGMARKLTAEAKVAEASRQTDLANTKTTASEQARIDADSQSRQAIKMLLAVIRKNPSRERSAEPLVALCIRQKDHKSLDEVKQILEQAENPPPMATIRLVTSELRNISDRTSTEFNRKLDEAIKRVDSLLASHPDDGRLKLMRAGLAMKKSDTATANKLATEILKVEPRNSMAQMLLARVQMAEGRFADAEKQLFDLKAEFPHRIAAHYWYAVAADATDKEQLAKEAMRTVTRLEPIEPDDHALIAEAHRYLAEKFLADFPQNAYEDARKCYENNPNNPEAVWLLVRAAHKNDRLKPAQQTLAEAATGSDVSATMLMTVFRGYDLLGNHTQATDALNRAANTKPKNADERYNVILAKLLTHRTSDAMRLANEAIQEDPNSPKSHFVMAKVYNATRRGLQAREHFRKAVELNSRSPEYRIDLAKSLRKTGELDEALEVLKPVLAISESAREMELDIKILQAKPGEIAAAAQESGKLLSELQLAQAYLIKGQVKQCIEICKAELKKQPDSYTGRMLLGKALLATNEIDKCIEIWTPLIAAKPDELLAYQNLADALKRQAGPKSQPQEIHKPLADIPGSSPEMVNSAIAWLCQKFGKHLDAAEFYEKVAMDAEDNQAMRYKASLLQAECLAKARQAEKALAVLDKLVDDENFKTESKKTFAIRANMLIRLRRLPEADATLDRLFQAAKAERDIPYLNSVVEAFTQIRQMDKALTACDAIQSIRPEESSIYVLRARVLEQFHKLDQAGLQYRKAMELNPTDLNIYVRLANNLDAQLKPIEAMKTLGNLKALGQTGRSQAILHEAKLYARWGLKDRAIERLKTLDETADRTNSPETNLELAKFLASLHLIDRAKTILVRIPEHAREYIPARLLLAQLADTLEHKRAIIRALANKFPAITEILAREMAIFLADGKPDQAIKTFTIFRAEPKHKGVIPVTAAVFAITAAIEVGDLSLAARAARELAVARVGAQWPMVAAVLALDVDPNSAGRLLPKPPQARGLEPVLGLCLAKKTNDPNAARLWASRLDETLFKTTDGQPPSNQADRYRFLCALLIGDNGQIQPALAKLTARQSIVSRAARELADNLKKNPSKSTDELVTLIQAELAMNAQQVYLARLWATKALKARPTCQWAATMLIQLADKRSVTDALKAQVPCKWTKTLLMQKANQRSQLEKVAALLEPTNCYLARILRARILSIDIVGQYAESAKIYDSLSEAEKKEPGIAYEHGGVEEKAGNLDKALALYRQAWKDANNPVAANNAAYVIAKLHPEDKEQLKKASELAEKARKALPFAPHFDTAGWIAHLQGRNDEALNMLRIAVKGMSNSAEVHYHVGLAEAAAGNRGLGRMHLAAAMRIGKELRAADAKLRPSETAAADLAKQAYYEIEPE